MATLQTYRRTLARSLDDLGTYVVLSATAYTVTISPLTVSDANAAVTRYDGRYAYVATGAAAGTQRTIKRGGYAPSTGVLTVANASGWDTAISPGDVIELTSLFPCLAAPTAYTAIGEDTDYRTLVNRALAHLTVLDHLEITTVANQQEYSLSAYAAWLTRSERLTAVLDPPRATGFARVPTWRRWGLKLDGGTPTLTFFDRAYPVSGASLQAVVLRPADTLVNGAESTVGLVADTDTALASAEDVATWGLVFAYEALMHRQPGQPSDPTARAKWEAQREIARGLASYDRTREQAAEQPAKAVA